MILKAHRRPPGFTLVELLLTVSLVLLFIGAAVFHFSSLQKNAGLEAGATQVEALFRFARAHAATTGRQVKITFEDSSVTNSPPATDGVRVSWEPDPVAAPGVFQRLPETAGYVKGISELVSVREVRTGTDATDPVVARPDGASPLTKGPEAIPAPLETPRSGSTDVVFYPDGSSTSAEVILASRNEVDERRLSVRLRGVTGSLRRQLVSESSVANETAASRPSAEIAAEEGK